MHFLVKNLYLDIKNFKKISQYMHLTFQNLF